MSMLLVCGFLSTAAAFVGPMSQMTGRFLTNSARLQPLSQRDGLRVGRLQGHGRVSRVAIAMSEPVKREKEKELQEKIDSAASANDVSADEAKKFDIGVSQFQQVYLLYVQTNPL